MRKRPAFTFIELMISFVIFSFLLLLIYNVVIQSSRMGKIADTIGDQCFEEYFARVTMADDFRSYVSAPGWADDRTSYVCKSDKIVFWCSLCRPNSIKGIHIAEYRLETDPRSKSKRLVRNIYFRPPGSMRDLSNYDKMPPQLKQYFLDGVVSLDISFTDSPEPASCKPWTDPDAEPPHVVVKIDRRSGKEIVWSFDFGPAN